MSQLSTFEKYLFIIRELEQKGFADPYDKEIQESLELGQKQINRLLHELSIAFDSVVCEKNGKKKTYRLIRPIDLFTETFKNSHELGWLFNMAHDADPEIFKELEAYTNQNHHVYRFKNSPFEDIATLESREVFRRLRDGVKNREYRKIKFTYDETAHDNLKCLKLIFMDNNWYIAFVDEEDKLRFGRISFIEEVKYAAKIGSFHPSSVEEHLAFLDKVQNSMTLFGAHKKVARLKASPGIARYFEEGMKKFLLSQEYIRTEPDGSVIFTLEYTQPLEILPLVQRWLPDIAILEPQELKDEFAQKLTHALQNYNKSLSDHMKV